MGWVGWGGVAPSVFRRLLDECLNIFFPVSGLRGRHLCVRGNSLNPSAKRGTRASWLCTKFHRCTLTESSSASYLTFVQKLCNLTKGVSRKVCLGARLAA
jgi:hypothetical protein